MTITELLEARPFKVTIDNKKRHQVTVVLGWQPEPPPSSPAPEDLSEATPTALIRPNRKKQQGKMVAVKKEPIEKRPISAGSAERNISAKRLPIGQPNVRTRGSTVKEDHPIKQEDPVKEEPTEELQDLQEILRNAGKRM
jgi:hypothetical protein